MAADGEQSYERAFSKRNRRRLIIDVSGPSPLNSPIHLPCFGATLDVHDKDPTEEEECDEVREREREGERERSEKQVIKR